MIIETFTDWFAGVGGFRLGLERLGLTCIGACENDKPCRQIYEKNFGHEPEFSDATEVDPDSVPYHDLFAAGFPCQAFSVSGKRRGFRDTRGTVFFEICRILAHKRPAYILLENVKGLLSAPYVDEGGTTIPETKGWVFYKVLESLGELGYDLQWEVLNSRYFGLPQSRERVYIIGHLGGLPAPDVFPFFHDAGAVEANPSRNLGKLGRLHTHQGGSVYGPGNICGTLDTGKGPLLHTHGRLRRATMVERERIQGFPDNWTEGVSNSQRIKQTGNAASPVVIGAIGRKLLDEVWRLDARGELEQADDRR